RALLEENEELRLEIERKIIEHLGMNPEALTIAEDDLADEAEAAAEEL
ncbi:MAG: DNA recombination/repair protein RecA, partial [Desulfovibrio sp.]|nr:DNA recombination/repair protein RecA [Desulfovibrio sp.]